MQHNNLDTMVACTRCTSSVPIENTTYDSNGKKLICFGCYNKLVKGIIPDRVLQSAEIPTRFNYTCLSCGFKFSRAISFQFGGGCFNCGKQAIQKDLTKEMIFRDRKSLLDY